MKHLLLVLAFAFVAGACGSGGEPATGTGGTSSKVAKVFAVGQAMVASDGHSVTVLSFKRTYSTGNEFDVPKAGNEYVQVTYAVSNGASTEWSGPLYEVSVVDANGQKYSSGFVTGQGHVDSLVAGGKAPSVTQVYEVPTGSALDVVWTPNMFESTVFQTPLK